MTDDKTPELRTRTGKVLTDTEIQALADEAERGYDVKVPQLPGLVRNGPHYRVIYVTSPGQDHPTLWEFVGVFVKEDESHYTFSTTGRPLGDVRIHKTAVQEIWSTTRPLHAVQLVAAETRLL